MPERGFDTGFWTDPFVVKLPFEAKGLFLYLWTNDHCNQAGLYEIAPETIASETKLPEDILPDLFSRLEPKVKWYPEQNLVWVRNFIKRQSKSPKFLIAVAKSLTTIHNNGAISELLEYNSKRYSISIPYPYHTDTVAIPSSAGADLICSSAGADAVKGERIQRGEENLAVISKAYEENIGIITPMIAEKLKDMAGRYPAEWFKDAVAEAVKSNVRKLSYVESILKRWATEGKGSLKSKIKSKAVDPDKYIKGKYGHIVQR